MEGEWSCYRSGRFNELEKGHDIEMASLKEGEWCYRGGQFNRGRMFILQRFSP